MNLKLFISKKLNSQCKGIINNKARQYNTKKRKVKLFLRLQGFFIQPESATESSYLQSELPVDDIYYCLITFNV